MPGFAMAENSTNSDRTMKTEPIKTKRKYYYYLEACPNCYSLHRPDGSIIAFLQGDDALEFEKVIQKLRSLDYPHGLFRSFEHLLSMNIDCYDLLSDISENSTCVAV